MILENILSSSSLVPETLIPFLVVSLREKSEQWAFKVPPMLFPPHRLSEAFEEVLFDLSYFIFISFITISNTFISLLY